MSTAIFNLVSYWAVRLISLSKTFKLHNLIIQSSGLKETSHAR